MIIDMLVKLDDRKRIMFSVVITLVIAVICYYVIARSSVVNLQKSQGKYAAIQAAFAANENQYTDFLKLRDDSEQLALMVELLSEQCFTARQAPKFLENINARAIAYNLKPISAVICEPEPFVVATGEKDNDRFVLRQVAKIAVVGNYFDIVDFLGDLVNRNQKIQITNLRIALMGDEVFNPTASFNLVLLIDLSKQVSEI